MKTLAKHILDAVNEAMAISRTPIDVQISYASMNIDPEVARKAIKLSVDNYGGYTDNYLETGYITPEGLMVDMSGKAHGKRPGKMYYFHQDLPEFDDYDDFKGVDTERKVGFILNCGMIRVDFIRGVIHLSRPMTSKQKSTILQCLGICDKNVFKYDVEDMRTGKLVYLAIFSSKDTRSFLRAVNESEAVMRGERAQEIVSFVEDE